MEALGELLCGVIKAGFHVFFEIFFQMVGSRTRRPWREVFALGLLGALLVVLVMFAVS